MNNAGQDGPEISATVEAMANEIEYEVSERIAQLRINRSKAMNSIHPDLMAEVRDQNRIRENYGEPEIS